MGLVMNEHGFLHRTSILPGNAAEPKTLEEMFTTSLYAPRVLFGLKRKLPRSNY